VRRGHQEREEQREGEDEQAGHDVLHQRPEVLPLRPAQGEEEEVEDEGAEAGVEGVGHLSPR
jgi:hypothetical protein